MNDELDNMLSTIRQKDASVLCREVTSIGDAMDVLRARLSRSRESDRMEKAAKTVVKSARI